MVQRVHARERARPRNHAAASAQSAATAKSRAAGDNSGASAPLPKIAATGSSSTKNAPTATGHRARSAANGAIAAMAIVETASVCASTRMEATLQTFTISAMASGR